jgi:hypothetical protein
MVLRRRNGGECELANTQADGNSGAIVAPTIIAAILVRVSAPTAGTAVRLGNSRCRANQGKGHSGTNKAFHDI